MMGENIEFILIVFCDDENKVNKNRIIQINK
jgi:hypothetical protein